MGVLESMLSSWRSHPDAELTISLCSYLRASGSDSLISEVGFKAESVHRADIDVLVAVARMYLGADRLSDALRVFIAARNADAVDPRPYRYLTEVLLRQGEASRAHSIAMRAIERGIGDSDLETWLDRARSFVEVERHEGTHAVAARVNTELARTSNDSSPRRPLPFESSVEVSSAELLSIPDAPAEDEAVELESDAMLSIPDGDAEMVRGHPLPFELGSDVALSIPDDEVSLEDDADDRTHVLDAQRPAELDDDDLTNVLGHDEVERLGSYDDETTHVLDDEHTRELLAQTRRSSPPPPPLGALPGFALEEDERTTAGRVGPPPRPALGGPPRPLPAPPAPQRIPSSLPPPRPRNEAAVTTSRPPPRTGLPSFDISDDLPPPPTSGAARGPQPNRPGAGIAPMPVRPISAPPGAHPPSRPPTPPPPVSKAPPSHKHVPTLPPGPTMLGARPLSAPPPPTPALTPSRPPVQYAPPKQSSPRASVPADEDSIIVAGHAHVSPSQRPPTPTVPPSRPSGRPGSRAETIRIDRRASVPPKKRSSWFHTLSLFVMLGALAAGAVVLYRKNDAEKRELLREREGLQQAVQLLRSGHASELVQARTVLEGEKRPMLEAYAAQLVLRERVLRFVVSGDKPSDIGEALEHARSVGVSSKGLCAAEVVAPLTRGDLSGAITALKKDATIGRQDPYFRMIAGYTYEQLGDDQALTEYATAHELDPGLAIAAVLHARLLVLAKGSEAARAEVESIASGLPDHVQADALRALLEALRPPGTPGGNATTLDAATVARLPAPLQPVAGLQAARKALAAGDVDAARAGAEQASSRTASPFLVARVAEMALAARDIELPLTIAGRLEQIDSDDPTARILRARVALLKGDLAQASRLVDRMDKANGVQVDRGARAVVRGIIAYERQDLAALRGVLDALKDDEGARVDLSALRIGADLMQGHAPSAEAIDALAHGAAPWADLIAVDAALDLGRTEQANRLMSGWTDVLGRPLHLVRVARLARYAGRVADAATSSRQALDAGAKTFEAVTENVYALIAHNAARVAEQTVNQYSNIEGPPVGVWLRVSVRGMAGRPLLMSAKLPGTESALHVRILAAYALYRAKDMRLKAVATELQALAPAQPDIVALASAAR